MISNFKTQILSFQIYENTDPEDQKRDPQSTQMIYSIEGAADHTVDCVTKKGRNKRGASGEDRLAAAGLPN